MLPDKKRPEWKELVTGQKTVTLKNFVLQMKVTQAIKDIKAGKTTPEKAVDEIYELCSKYEKAVMPDMDAIFN